MYQSKCQFRVSMAVKVDPDSGRKLYCYVATRAWREIAPATQIQWNERIIGKLVRMAGVSTAQAEFLLPIMETGGWIGLILTEIFYGQATGLLSFINRQELFFTHYSFHGLFIGKVTEEWMALQCVLYRMLTTIVLGINSEKQKMYLKSMKCCLNIRVLIVFLYISTLCDTIVFWWIDEMMRLLFGFWLCQIRIKVWF